MLRACFRFNPQNPVRILTSSISWTCRIWISSAFRSSYRTGSPVHGPFPWQSPSSPSAWLSWPWSWPFPWPWQRLWPVHRRPEPPCLPWPWPWPACEPEARPRPWLWRPSSLASCSGLSGVSAGASAFSGADLAGFLAVGAFFSGLAAGAAGAGLRAGAGRLTGSAPGAARCALAAAISLGPRS